LNNGAVDREAKRALFDAFSTVGKAVSSGRRVEILDVLANGPRSVEGVAQQVALSVANASQHLQVLRQAGLVSAQRRGTSVIYRLSSPDVFTFLSSLRTLASRRLAEIDRLAADYLGGSDAVEEIAREELARRLESGDGPIIVDVRPREEFEAGHPPGALSIPVDELAKRIKELPRDREIVTYCRGPYCAYSHVAVRLLRKRGFRAVRLQDGLPEWEAAELPVQRDSSG
jgi:rhodanese-related sulfurtransferase/predicted transcriptional regulator